MSLIPTAIIKEIKELPPFQREALSESYAGQFVQWDVVLVSVFGGSNGLNRLHLKYKNEFIPSIFCDVDLQKYPHFKLMKEREHFTLKGYIEKVDEVTIYLKDCEFIFQNMAEPAALSSVAAIPPASTIHINMHNSPGASINQGSHIGSHLGAIQVPSSVPKDGWLWWIKTIISGFIVAILTIIFAYYYNLNGNKNDETGVLKDATLESPSL